MNQRDQRTSGATGAEPDVPEPPSNAPHGADSLARSPSADDTEPHRDPGAASGASETAPTDDSNGRGGFHDGEAETIEQPRVEIPDPPEDPAGPAAAPTTADEPDDSSNGGGIPAPASSPPPPPPPVLSTQPPPPGRHLRRGGLILDHSEATPDKAADRRRLALLGAAASPVALIAIIIVAWAIDNAFHSGQVHRNVELSGHAVGGATEESLPGVIKTATQEAGEREVVVVIKGEETQTTAGDLGVVVDEQATMDAAKKVGRTGSLFLRPFRWVGSFFTPRHVSPVYAVNETQVSTGLQELQNAETEESATPVEPRVELANGEFVMVPGRAGTDLDISKAASDLLAAVEDSEDPSAPIVLTATTAEVEPAIPDQQAVDLANQANSLTEQGLSLVVDDEHTRELSRDQLREWTHPVLSPQEQRLDFDAEAAGARVPELFSDLSSEPKNASVSLVNGKPQITDGKPGYTCCGEDVGARVWQTLQENQEGQPRLELETDKQEPEFTKAAVEAWGIKEPVGGSRAWANGQGDVPGPKAGFTTFEACCGARQHNIRLMADEVNGAVIPPGGTFSINEHVGARQCPPYQPAGAIREGEHVEDECGGGTSQFGTTFFNAAYFAGLDITQSTAHSEYFGRYPLGREATMGVPGSALDVALRNNTEYGVLIQTSYEGDALTVTFWSTQHIDVKQSAIEDKTSGDCRYVTTTRTRTFPGGATKNDTFSAKYRLKEGVNC